MYRESLRLKLQNSIRRFIARCYLRNAIQYQGSCIAKCLQRREQCIYNACASKKNRATIRIQSVIRRWIGLKTYKKLILINKVKVLQTWYKERNRLLKCKAVRKLIVMWKLFRSWLRYYKLIVMKSISIVCRRRRRCVIRIQRYKYNIILYFQ